ncbi:MAG: hypothetical protein Fur0020_03600 [Thermodesulfovibrionia bacterium]
MSKALLVNIIKEKPYLFWDVKDMENLSEESIVEAILNRGDFDDFLRLIDVLGTKRVAGIFYKQVSKPRKNYSKKTENYFRIFFERHLKDV